MKYCLYSLLMLQLTACTPTAMSKASILNIQDRMALKHLVDTFSNLADTKDVDRQVLLFTENATVESYRGGTRTSKLTGREEIGTAFRNFLDLFDTVYHLNGQQTVEIDGNSATGTAYCLVVLIDEQDDRTVKTTHGVTYRDHYLKQGGEWLIARRKSYFEWSSTEEL